MEASCLPRHDIHPSLGTLTEDFGSIVLDDRLALATASMYRGLTGEGCPGRSVDIRPEKLRRCPLF
ncbi:uncharacterized protein RAG0_14241 [Rhynchosporium agropyri]|uniref:Uncharacterized protein n=2 Tax=Rhynchosporium TaxID=38037 RepID=A0A1E1MCW8_RHYSE|nr:uncharacterized protein RAG0_14241 [Rhynchosporium agropyri]CZT46949.1 uncharacterized protein RSE6_07463 [Rhynchosporium secalis]